MKEWKKRAQQHHQNLMCNISTNKPLVSVLMPVYNGERYLRIAIDSMLTQTMGDFELIVIDDASSDSSPAILASYTDPRLRVIRHIKNKGIVQALNNGLVEAHGRYIARMDADDISYPKRLEKQVAFLDAHPEIGLVGSWIQCFGDVRREYIHRYPVGHEEIQATLLFENPFAHPSMMFRHAIIENLAKPYSPDFPYVEDWELWARMLSFGNGANIPMPLIKYRIHKKSSSHIFTDTQRKSKRRLMRHIYAEAELPFRKDLILEPPVSDMKWLKECYKYFKKLLEASENSQRFNGSVFSGVLQVQFYRRTREMSFYGISAAWFIFGNNFVEVPVSVRTINALKVFIRTNVRAFIKIKRNRSEGGGR